MKKISFNKDWVFCGKKITLPHDAMLAETRDPECKNGVNTSWFPGGVYEYTKRFMIPWKWKEQAVLLEFEGIYRNVSVYLNDVLLKEHHFGYTGFYVNLCEINGLLKISKEENGTEKDCSGMENILRVVVNNSAEPNSRWYSGSGIYRDVWLYVGNREHIIPDSLQITTVSVKPTVLEVNCRISGERKEKEGTNYHLSVEVQKQENHAGTAVRRDGVLPLRIEIPDARLWDADNPFLYQIKCRLYRNNFFLDEQTIIYGIRRITWSAQDGLCINGEETKLRGTCIHHDNGILGACAYPAAEERKIRKIKEAGFNAIRSAHNPCSKALLDACDKYGVYVLDEAFDQWYIPKNGNDYARDFEKCHRQNIKEMAEKDYNHASVILYSIGNEISETQQARGILLTQEMVQYLHQLDSSRPVTCGINLFLNGLASRGIGIYSEDGSGLASKRDEEGTQAEKLSGSAFFNYMMEHMGAIKNLVSGSSFADKASRDAFSKLDICGYNYGSARYKKDGKKYPARIIVGSETFIPDIYDNWKKVQKYSYLIGDFIWVGWDYLGEAGIGHWGYGKDNCFRNYYPRLLAESGAIDITGMVTPEMYQIQAAYGLLNAPKIGVRPVNHSGEAVSRSPWRSTDAVESWTWKGCEGKIAQVEVYTVEAKVRLNLNGKVIKTRRTKKSMACFKLPYAPGVLKAESIDEQGKVTGVAELTTASNKTRLSVEKEDLGTLIYFNISVTDENGIVKPLEEKKIHVEVEGGRLLALGSANPTTEEGFLSDTHMTWQGRAQAVILRETDRNITVKISEAGDKMQQIFEISHP